MSTATKNQSSSTARVDRVDWPTIVKEINIHGFAMTSQILHRSESKSLAELYDQVAHFRSTIDMARYRFGSGQYRYFDNPLPELVAELRRAFYPHLLPIARDWAEKLDKPAPWPATLERWLEMCHEAGQTKPTPILLRYQSGDWNALHRDLYGDLVFPLQVVIGLNEPGVDHTGGEFSWSSSVRVLSHEASHALSSKATRSSSRRESDPSSPNVDGPRDQCVMVSPRCAQAFDTRSDWFSTTPHDAEDLPLAGAGVGSYPSDARGSLGGNCRSKLYGRLDCRAALRAPARGGYLAWKEAE